MKTVYLVKSSYEYPRLRDDVFSILANIDKGLIFPNAKVLIKPNMLMPARPDEAIITHPLVVRAAVEYVLEKGGRPTVSDSPALGKFDKAVKVSGLGDALSGLPVAIKSLSDSRKAEAGGRFKSIELSGDALDADAIVNLPKLKTHSQMVLTLAVKNLFGCVVDMRKAQWHMRIGENEELFAELLLRIWERLSPGINLIDGILAMEGQGPGTGGTPRRLGALLGSEDALALDCAVADMLRIGHQKVPHIRTAEALGMKSEYRVEGDMPRVVDFALPKSVDIVFGPKFMRGFIRKHITRRPSGNPDACRLCGECWKICPQKAITRKREKLCFDYDKCIRCYCCLEVCPHKAVKVEETAVRKLLNKFYGDRGL